MKRYAIKIGEVHVVAAKPITEQQRKAFIKILLSLGKDALCVDGVEISINSH